MLCPMCRMIDSHLEFCPNADLDSDAWLTPSPELEAELDESDPKEVLARALEKTVFEAMVVSYGEELAQEAEMFANYGVV